MTPSLNQGRFIGSALESVAMQRYPHIEHLVIDGGSTDETAAEVARFTGRVVWVSEPDKGQTDALNKGFRLARGSILSWLNADDRLLPGAIERVVAAYERNRSAGLFYGGGRWIDERGEPLGDYQPPEHWGRTEMVSLSAFILQPAAFFTRAAFDEVGPLREDLDYTMDWDLFIRIGARFPMIRIPGPPLAEARLHGATKTANGGLPRLAEIARVSRAYSDRALPPSVALYAVETALQLARRGLRHLRPGLDPVCGPTTDDALSRLQQRLCAAIVSRSVSVQSDGWATRHVERLLPPGRPAITIAGHVPGWIPDGRQELVIAVNGSVVRRATVGPGEFRVDIPFTSTERPVSLSIDAARTFVPARVGVPGNDTRRLAWLVRSIGWSPSTEDSS